MSNPIIIFVTAANPDEAVLIADTLVSEKLAACGNIIPNVHSTFVWKGNIEKEEEVLLLLKSNQQHLTKIIDRVKELHSYDVPEVIALPIAGGSEDYFEWLRTSVS